MRTIVVRRMATVARMPAPLKSGNKRHEPALVAALTGGLAASLATLAGTESPDKPGKSNLADMAERAKDKVVGKRQRKVRTSRAARESRAASSLEMEDTRVRDDQDEVQPQLT